MKKRPHGAALPRLAPLLALALSACALGPDFKRPDAPVDSTYLPSGSAGASMASPAEVPVEVPAKVPVNWWTRLGSPTLDQLVRQARSANPSLQAAQATLRRSQDELSAGHGVFYPQIGFNASALRQDGLLVQNRQPLNSGTYGVFTQAASVSYAPDLFGAQRRTVEGLAARADGARYALAAARVTLSANLVNTVIARAGYQAQRDTLARIVGLQDEQARIALAQYEAGTASFAPVLALRGARASNEATIASLEQRIAQSEHLLAQLSGSAPAQFQPPPLALSDLQLPAELPQLLPAELVRRRPDILIAEADLHAASAQIGVATADLFPSLTLSATDGLAQGTAAHLLDASTRYWSLQASLVGSIFSGGSQWFARRAAIDAYDASLAQYRETVLAALAQVADVLTALDHDARALSADREAEAAAAAQLKIVETDFEAGLVGYLELGNADMQWRQTRLALLAATAQQLQDAVALYVAMGGGWWNASADPAEAE